MKLIWVRPKIQLIHLRTFVFNPGINDIFRKDISLEKEFMVFFKRVQGLWQRFGNGFDFGFFLVREFIDIFFNEYTGTIAFTLIENKKTDFRCR